MSVRVYGCLAGHSSRAQVTRGFTGALQDAWRLAGVVALDWDASPGAAPPTGAAAHHAVFTGPPGLMDRMVRGQHERRWVMVAPNSDKIPVGLGVWLARFATDVMVPSRWAADVMDEQQELPVHVVPHGVSAKFKPDVRLQKKVCDAYREGHFRVVHFSTSDRERKGTLQLLQAWEMLWDNGELPKRAELMLVMDHDAMGPIHEWIAERGKPCPKAFIVPRQNSSPATMALTLSSSHLVCQPSRGEGFGLVPLEARACGVPVVATTCTGHSEHMTDGMPGVVGVVHGPLAPIDDVPGARAPSVDPDAIAGALRGAYEGWKQLSQDARNAAAKVGSEWAWNVRLAPWIDSLTGETK